jgi:hypothetical protein
MWNGCSALSDFSVSLSEENQLSEVDESELLLLLLSDVDDDDVDFSPSFRGGGLRLRPPVVGQTVSLP